MFKDPSSDVAASAADPVDSRALLTPLADVGLLSKERGRALTDKLNRFFEAVRAPSKKTDEAFWTEFQKEFGFATLAPSERITPMNAANLCPEPTALIESLNELRLEYNLNVSQQMRTAQGERVRQLEQARKSLAFGLGLTDPNDLAIMRNATEANNAINCGFRDWSADGNDTVVMWAENHPTNREAWRMRAEWPGRPTPFQVVEVSFPTNASEADIAAAFISRITPRTRFVTYTETANSNGFRMPEPVMKAVWDHVKANRPDCHIHIDGTMAWGARPLNLANAYCHSLVSSAHKWFLGPKETGILFMRKEKARNFMPSIYGYDYRIVIVPYRELPENALRFELIGQRDDVNIIALNLTQRMWSELQPRRPYERIAQLAQHLMSRLQRTGSRWKLVTPSDPARSWGVVRVEAPKEHREKTLYDWLYEDPRYRIAGSGDAKTFRLCPHIYNTIADVDRAVDGMNAWYEDRRS
ncbi:aminotransferase class V-fold PLP-dependent enzyme [Myxococcus fulvus]|uniref:aminotransferase class V-fold PLP-dependent enzyme n=1 Tax=Myxococcus fulvus TaxID=33 RepID=UPI003B9912C8